MPHPPQNKTNPSNLDLDPIAAFDSGRSDVLRGKSFGSRCIALCLQGFLLCDNLAQTRNGVPVYMPEKQKKYQLLGCVLFALLLAFFLLSREFFSCKFSICILSGSFCSLFCGRASVVGVCAFERTK